MSYEQFLNMCSLLKFKRGDKEKMIDFTVRLFDPVMAGFTPNQQFEDLIELMFEVEQAEPEAKKSNLKVPEKKPTESETKS